MVGQRFIQMLNGHKWFDIEALMASERSAGQIYKERVNWLLATPIPDEIAEMKILSTNPNSVDVDLVFSALPSDIARQVEPEFAKQGIPVVSNVSSHRMDPDVPLIISEVNSDHLDLIPIQKEKRDWSGFIVTDPNCTTIGLAMVLKPIYDAFGISSVFVVTMQAISGAGFPGVPSMSIFDNIIPYIKGEEEKVCKETLKILGKFDGRHIENAGFKISASCNRVPVLEGHFESVLINTKENFEIDEVKKALSRFSGIPQELELPSAPKFPIIVREEIDRPQTRLDRMAGEGMSVTVGRIRRGFDEKTLLLNLISHNTIRGAAGAALLIGETLVAQNCI